MIKDTIIKFHAQHLSDLTLELSDLENDNINMYISKFDSSYQLGVNINTIRKMGLNQNELLCLLWHEKGHLDLKHLEVEQNIFINFVLTLLVGICLICSGIFNIFLGIGWITISLAIFFLFLSYGHLKSLSSMRQKELEADLYASQHCGVENVKNMLIKMGAYYNIDIKYSSFLSTHPSVSKRVKNIMKKPV